ncbi:hypothetical protein BDV96DRAFT_485905 [Lophiotrema nucula]|uniref:U3 small nucleolar RNA-associated protein 10 n=1 Tax=Lophiotrema nucula TaxID=690887 RepID=A0A6A5ZPW9_9PLEO|nr:hypothetical protein BDV96DRAFT_485905 [Lophiotrema nucula]
MTSLQRQLAAIAASSTHQLDLKAQKAAHGKSLLYEPRVAASQSFDNIYLICQEGFRNLCALDHRFLPFSKTIFSEQSKEEDRTQRTKKENQELDTVLEAFITLVGPRLLLKPAEKALEWLVRRFRVHEYNTECLVLTYLPYHATPQFLALLSILPASPPPTLRFLHPYISSPTNPPRQTIVYTAVNTPAFFNALQSYVVKVLQASHFGPGLLSFWSSITTQAVDAILEQSQSGRRGIQDQRVEELLLRVLPSINECLTLTDIPEAVLGCYMIIIVLVTKAALEDKVLDAIMEAVAWSQENETLDGCLMCLAIIAEERSQFDIPVKVSRRLFKIPNIARRLSSLAGKCRVESLALGCALAAVQGIGSNVRSEECRALFGDTISSGVFGKSHTTLAVSSLLQKAHECEPGSTERAQLVDIATQLSEGPSSSGFLHDVLEVHSKDLESLGITLQSTLAIDYGQEEDSEDEEMLEVADDEDQQADAAIFLPAITEVSFLDPASTPSFRSAAQAFENAALSKKKLARLLKAEELQSEQATTEPLYLSFLMRMWCSNLSNSARLGALRSASVALKRFQSGVDLQVLIPYLLYALGDSSQAIRRAAAACVTFIAEQSTNNKSKARVWGALNVYGQESSKISKLQPEQTSAILTSALVPSLEECVMDASFMTTSIRHILEGTHAGKPHTTTSLKSAVRASFASFLASHITLTPLLRVQCRLLPIFDLPGKSVGSERTHTLIPYLKQWFSQPLANVTIRCESEGVDNLEADAMHLAALLPRERESAELLKNIVSGSIGKERIFLLNMAFDRLASIWSSMKSEFRLSLSQSLLDSSLEDSTSGTFEETRRIRSLETLKNVKLDTAILVSFVETIPSATKMPDGPPSKRRRRSSRNEIARTELRSPDDVARLLQKVTLILELVESSGPSQHPALFRNLFGILDELQQLKQQSRSDLVYLQSLVLGSINDMVPTIKEQQDQAEYQASVRADLLIECIRHSASPQIQNAALLLVGSLASWVPEVVLHNLMPIFTFMGSNLLRQQDDYSAHVVDQTISRVVPQLAKSLRSKQRNFLQGVADLLLSFTAAFEHIPSHRRLKLFQELARTLGPEDSLSAIVALLVDRYPTSPAQRKFVPELLLHFGPDAILHTFRGYLDLVVDAAGSKRKISDTLFAFNEKQPAQRETSLLHLISSLADLTADTTLRSHVRRAFKRNAESSQARTLFASILETTVQVSKQVAKSQRQYEACRRALANCLDLLPTIDLIKSAELLVENPDSQVQVAAVKAVEVRAGSVAQNDRSAVTTLLAFLPKVENILKQSKAVEVKIIAISCIDKVVERFGKKDVPAVASIAQFISGSQALASTDDRVRILSLLCLASIVSVLEDETISLLPTVLPTAFQYLKQSIEDEKEGLHNAVYSLLSEVIERLAFMFSREYLVPALELSHKSATAGLAGTCEQSRQQFYQSISKHLDAQEVFVAIKATWQSALDSGYEASHEQLELIDATIETQTKAKMIKASSTLFSLLLDTFNLRSAIASREEEEYDDEEVTSLENSLIEAVVAMILKLNDATFRPFFAQLVDQTPVSDTARSITFNKFLAAFFDKFKSIVTSYSSYILEPSAQLLERLANSDNGDDDDDDSTEELRSAVLSALKNTFEHDTDGFWQTPSHYSTILSPLLRQLTLPTSSTSQISSHVIPAITELAAASASSLENHREMNTILLKYMRAEEPHTRLATVLCEQSLTKRLGEEWLALLPEMLPFVSELREDDEESVERETQRWINSMEGILGEDLGEMLQ